MANYYASCRTNYFKVKDAEAFKAEMDKIPGVEVCNESDNTFCLLGDDPDGAGWPTWIWSDLEEDHVEVDLMAEVADHLADGEVAIFMEAGAEKLRYICGLAVAVNNKHEYRRIALNDIYQLAEELTDRPDEISVAEY